MSETKSGTTKNARRATLVKTNRTIARAGKNAQAVVRAKAAKNEGEKEMPKVKIITDETDDLKTAAKEEAAITIKPKRKILFAASECTPFIATGGLAEVIGSLSKSLAQDEEYDVRVVLPLYSDIRGDYRQRFTYLGNINVPLGWRNQYCGIFSYEESGVTFYFLDNEYYFRRGGCYGYYDDGERFAFFSRAVMEILGFLQFYPDVLHCHDWQSALAAIYLKTIYCHRREYSLIRAVFTIHNIEYQGKYSLDVLEDLFGISNDYRYLLEFDGCANLMKAAIECSETFTTVSPTYAEEIKRAEYAHGLQGEV